MNPTFSVSDFVAVFNQTIAYAYPTVTITGELANFRVSKGKWVYFDLKDDQASVRFFGTVYMLPGPLEDGMMLQIEGIPRLHQTFGFSITAQTITPVGEGSIKKAAALLEAKLVKEGLFAEERKRPIPYPPSRIGLIASGESAAYADFMKIITSRWGGLEIIHVDSQVQGSAAPAQIVQALDLLNARGEGIEAIIITRGGGSADDLQAFNVESVVRAIAASRIPTLVAIGHEIDVSLAERAADRRASTPSNAAELLVPDREAMIVQNKTRLKGCLQTLNYTLQALSKDIELQISQGLNSALDVIVQERHRLQQDILRLRGNDPRIILRKGYARIQDENKRTINSVEMVAPKDRIALRLSDGTIEAVVERVIK